MQLSGIICTSVSDPVDIIVFPVSGYNIAFLAIVPTLLRIASSIGRSALLLGIYMVPVTAPSANKPPPFNIRETFTFTIFVPYDIAPFNR